MALSSSRKLIANGLVSLLQGIIDPNTSVALYQGVKLGAYFDPSSFSGLWCEVVDPRGKLGHAGSGGNQVGWLVQDDIAFKITSGYIYQPDSTAAMNAILNAQDVMLPLFASHYQIPNPNNTSIPIASVYSLLEDQGQTDTTRPVKFPNGNVYLMWEVWVLVKQNYGVTIVSP